MRNKAYEESLKEKSDPEKHNRPIEAAQYAIVARTI
jgi:hypothetical protein